MMNRGGQSRKAVALVSEGRRPIGLAPKGRGYHWKQMWRYLINEFPWVDSTHRRWLIETTDQLIELGNIKAFFEEREKAMRKAGKPVALAYLTDDGGKRHPLMIQKQAHLEVVRRLLVSLGASPQSQVRLVTDAQRATESDHPASEYFSDGE